MLIKCRKIYGNLVLYWFYLYYLCIKIQMVIVSSGEEGRPRNPQPTVRRNLIGKRCDYYQKVLANQVKLC